jgi:putative ABC transport system substrate-binding protein
MRRREFIAGLGGAVAWPVVAWAQQPKIPLIGVLSITPPALRIVTEFQEGLKEAGYREGRDVSIAYRWGDNNPQTMLLARELVDAQPTAIVAVGGAFALIAAKNATSTIPIIYAGGVNPVKLGLAASLNRPGGNITGITFELNELVSKRLDLLLKLLPDVATVGYLTGDQSSAAEVGHVDQLLGAARVLGRRIIILECRSADDIERAFTTMAQEQVGALIVSAFPIAFNRRKMVLTLVADHRIPAIYAQTNYAREGGLMSYSPAGGLRQLAVQFVARILKGEKPGDLPIELPTKYELVINLKTAKALGLTIPETLLATADEVIE